MILDFHLISYNLPDFGRIANFGLPCIASNDIEIAGREKVESVSQRKLENTKRITGNINNRVYNSATYRNKISISFLLEHSHFRNLANDYRGIGKKRKSQRGRKGTERSDWLVEREIFFGQHVRN